MSRRGYGLLMGAILGLAGCGPPHAFRYLENPPAEEDTTESSNREAEDERHAWPIYDELPDEDCGPGLIGTSCERGLLQREAPIAEENRSDPEPRGE